MKVFVHQPEYLPWPGFFDRLGRCDMFVVYDDAQFEHGGFQNRNKIRIPHGWAWLTVPIIRNHPQLIKDVKINGTEWMEKHDRTIHQYYKKSPFFDNYFQFLEDAYSMEWTHLVDLDMYLIDTIAKILGIRIPMMKSSEMPIEAKEKNERLIEICKHLDADEYICGMGGRSYLDEKKYADNKIRVLWHAYNHPIYKQRFEGFLPSMSVIDLIFNLGPDSLESILGGGILSDSISNRSTRSLGQGSEQVRLA